MAVSVFKTELRGVTLRGWFDSTPSPPTPPPFQQMSCLLYLVPACLCDPLLGPGRGFSDFQEHLPHVVHHRLGLLMLASRVLLSRHDKLSDVVGLLGQSLVVRFQRRQLLQNFIHLFMNICLVGHAASPSVLRYKIFL